MTTHRFDPTSAPAADPLQIATRPAKPATVASSSIFIFALYERPPHFPGDPTAVSNESPSAAPTNELDPYEEDADAFEHLRDPAAAAEIANTKVLMTSEELSQARTHKGEKKISPECYQRNSPQDLILGDASDVTCWESAHFLPLWDILHLLSTSIRWSDWRAAGSFWRIWYWVSIYSTSFKLPIAFIALHILFVPSTTQAPHKNMVRAFCTLENQMAWIPSLLGSMNRASTPSHGDHVHTVCESTDNGLQRKIIHRGVRSVVGNNTKASNRQTRFSGRTGPTAKQAQVKKKKHAKRRAEDGPAPSRTGMSLVQLQRVLLGLEEAGYEESKNDSENLGLKDTEGGFVHAYAPFSSDRRLLVSYMGMRALTWRISSKDGLSMSKNIREGSDHQSHSSTMRPAPSRIAPRFGYSKSAMSGHQSMSIPSIAAGRLTFLFHHEHFWRHARDSSDHFLDSKTTSKSNVRREISTAQTEKAGC
ncbi:hypothetical protein B0H19DRAFT_1279062 [Mycena capillaripes]|nr:hypothetical protein B0H19DRAFT_1279062 [Mycena capillaripes]